MTDLLPHQQAIKTVVLGEGRLFFEPGLGKTPRFFGDVKKDAEFKFSTTCRIDPFDAWNFVRRPREQYTLARLLGHWDPRKNKRGRRLADKMRMMSR